MGVKLSDRELDAKCAELMGRVPVRTDAGEFLGFTDGRRWNYSVDPNLARELEDEIERRGEIRIILYNTALHDLAGLEEEDVSAIGLFRKIHASARHRAIAFCAAMEAGA